MTTYLIGTSGFVYKHWQGEFYPPDLPQSKWLEFYAQCFATVELNNTFYRLPSEASFRRWRETPPSQFLYAVKASRFITHIKRLHNVEESLETFLSRACLLEEKLGPLLYQLPPSMHRDDTRLEAFLKLLPQELSHVFEFRHESWCDTGVFDLLQRYNVGFCIYDMPSFTTPVVATTNFAYIRFHGSTGMYGGCYSDEELATWAERIANLGRDFRTVYIYFNNDAEGFAIRNALTLREQLT
jgi:uncharacterized protein YecE (DUF72 family)